MPLEPWKRFQRSAFVEALSWWAGSRGLHRTFCMLPRPQYLWGLLGLGVTEIWFQHASLPVSKFAAQKLHLLHGVIETPSEILWGQACSPETTVGEKGPQPDQW